MSDNRMYFPKAYKNIGKAKIASEIRKKGFSPMLFTNGPGDVYPQHSHPETKLLVFLSGSIEVTVNNKSFHCEAGDKLIIAGDAPHDAVVGQNGCTFYWSEKII